MQMRGIDPSAGQRCSNLWMHLNILSEIALINLALHDFCLLLSLIASNHI